MQGDKQIGSYETVGDCVDDLLKPELLQAKRIDAVLAFAAFARGNSPNFQTEITKLEQRSPTWKKLNENYPGRSTGHDTGTADVSRR